ncbi:aspartate carbamoyltransferase [candidate division TA06 bacterium]|uniref:Aspartate carbamoyltransferase n=1 Tax=candidate division TA06 bacterium TaxID=2250710 RepID=A0A660S8G7_UNCT6|nr:MAG: aspartate carbamoyltransferase [candidate division TA06 bacterium]
MEWKRKDLITIEELTPNEINLILDTAEPFKEILRRNIKKVPPLRGRTVLNLFFEPSTRTSASFSIAAKRLSAETMSISTSTSSVKKGETLLDTARNLEAMRVDMVVMRHSCEGAPKFLAERIEASVINAGDGNHEHPTQCLLDLSTLRENIKSFKGLKVLIVGDIAHSRVARSNIWGLTKLGAEVSVCAPPTLLPQNIDQLPVNVYYDMDKAIVDQDVIYLLRIQRERQKVGLFPSTREYMNLFSMDRDRLKKTKDDVIIMHPGPINRGVELDGDVADGKHSVILNQVTNGVAVRMAVLYLLNGGNKDEKII